MNKLTEWLKSDSLWSQFVLRSVILYRLTLQELLSSPRLRGLNTVKADFSHCKKTTTKKIKCIFFFYCTSNSLISIYVSSLNTKMTKA